MPPGIKNRTAGFGASVVIAAACGLTTTASADPCDADLDGSGSVGFGDLTSLLAAWGPCGGDPCPADLDESGDVGFTDIVELLASWELDCSGEVTETSLAARAVSAHPWAVYERTYTEASIISVAVDPAAHPSAIGQSVDVYVVANRTAAEWDADPMLVDVRGSAQSTFFAGPGLVDAIVDLTGFLPGDAGVDFGIGYDLVVDVNGDGMLSGGDLIDGRGDEAGFWVVDDTTEMGPLDVSTTLYSGGSFLGQIVRFPTEGGPYPLVVISHGNGHQYTWYQYLQEHLASHGYVVMSHQNNTPPGIETASTTTLTNTDYLLGNLDTVGGGQLAGKIDPNTIVWIGHSRGGEGVVRAYDRIRDGTFTPSNFTLDDIKLISSIAPTDFLGPVSSSPGTVWYHLLYGAADGDVSGAPNCAVCQSFSLYERATANRASTYVHGADHNDFNCCGFNDYCFGGSCPPAIGRTQAQEIAKAAYLALIEFVIGGEPAAEDFLYRQYEDLRPDSVGEQFIVDREYRRDPASPDTGAFVIDDFQTETSIGTSSSGGAVTGTVTNRSEGRLDDGNTTFTWTFSDPMNGMTRGRTQDTTRGTVFDWTVNAELEFEVIEAFQDVSGHTWLSWRSCVGTRHPNVGGLVDDLDYQVTLIDGSGNQSTLQLSTYLGGTQDTFARTGSGTGTGWQNEFETHRFRLADFVADGRTLDLTDIVAVRFDFGPLFGSPSGRLGFDDLEFTVR